MFKHTLRRVILLGLALSAGVALAASADAPGGKKPAAPKKAPVVSTPVETPKMLTERVCQSCHEFGVVSQSQHTADEWPAIVKRMRANGAELTEAQTKQIQVYLAETYSVKP